MSDSRALLRRILSLVLVGCVVLCVVASWQRLWGRKGGWGSPSGCRYDLGAVARTGTNGFLRPGVMWIKPGFSHVTALAVGPDDRVIIGTMTGVEILDVGGRPLARVHTPGPVRCLAVSPRGEVFAGLDNHVEVYEPDGTRKAVWSSPSPDTMLTSVAVSSNYAFVADCQNRVVWRYTLSGECSGKIGEKDPLNRPEGCVVPSAFFDVAVEPDGSLWVVNPGMHRVEHFTEDGRFLSSWGKESADDDGFCGCCNPSHIALTPQGTFVTSEKHIVRVKRYDARGSFSGLVSGPEEWGKTVVGLDLAVDSKGRILVLDPASDGVRVYSVSE